MKRRLAVLGVLLLGTLALIATGFLDPTPAHAAPCWIEADSCQTTCTGPMGVECCCLYHCRSGNTWVCQQGQYCQNTDRGCLGGI